MPSNTVPRLAVKVRSGDAWLLLKRNGDVIKSFDSEEELDEWYEAARTGEKKCRPPKLVVNIAGIYVREDLLSVDQGVKFRTDKGWYLRAVPRGNSFGRFETEEELDRWWEQFQLSQGRTPKPLATGPATSSQLAKTQRTARKKRTGDYLHPHSEKYDMPEYDLE